MTFVEREKNLVDFPVRFSKIEIRIGFYAQSLAGGEGSRKEGL